MKSRLTVTIEKDLLREIKLLAVNQEWTLSKLTEEAFKIMLEQLKDNKS